MYADACALLLAFCLLRQRALGAFLEGVRLVKFNAWECEIERAVKAARASELASIRSSSLTMAGNRCSGRA